RGGAGEPFEVGPFRITAAESRHPNGVLAWRVEADGRAVVYATDIEHGGAVDPRLVTLSAGADLLVHDAQYTDEEYAARRGWGHSTWAEAVDVAERAGVRRLALFHHDPRRDDDALAVLEDRARARFPGAFAAREGAVTALVPA
ncbi:MAG: MBL fold metallo-hydrolase, partial [Myxococcota bacterium]